MEITMNLIENYKEQIEYYYDIKQITGRVNRNNGTIESVIEGLHRSQKIIEKIKILDEKRKVDEIKFIKYHKMEYFDIANLPTEVSIELQKELIETMGELYCVIRNVLKYKVDEKTYIEEDFERAKEKIKETVKGTNAVRGYKKRSYDSVFVDKILK